jgi:DNA mismatch repair protein MutS
MPEITPMMEQYHRIKAEHRDSILFFRLGDFYEMFEKDALEASKLLDLTLTQRQGVPMCGIPYHAAEGYVGRLLRRGRKIAICEQLQLPEGRGLATREVVEVITPGTVVDEGYLDRNANNYLLALGRLDEALALAYIDLSTAEFRATSFPLEQGRERIQREFPRLAPREILLQESLLEHEWLQVLLAEQDGLVINRYPDWSFDLEANRQRLCRQLGVTNLKGFGLEDGSAEIVAAGVILEYVGESSKSILPHIRSLQVYTDANYVGLDEASQRNLELVQNLQDRSRRYTLLDVLDYTRTSMGSRHLRRWLLQPLKSRPQIEQRLEVVDFFYHNQVLLSQVRELLKGMFDLERLSARVALEKAHAKDLLAVKVSLQVALALEELLSGQAEEGASSLAAPFTALAMQKPEASAKQGREAALQEARGLVGLLEEAILEEPSVLLSEGNLIREGYNGELDRLRRIKEDARSILEEYLARERRQTGISSLKMKYNRVLGYYLEVTKPNLHLVPPHFIRRQSLVNGERYTTETLSEKESEILNASEQIVELERRLFLEVRGRVREKIDRLLELCAVVSRLDVLQSFAFAATVHGYVRPRLSDEPALRIEEGRHPVVEKHLPVGSFVPNDLRLDPQAGLFVLLTGPNMAGKSTFLRQVALIVLMAQVGSFVPAREAQIGLVDRVFCRVGATDNLARGESTFLVEMNETAHILRSATPRSLIILDEVGRGTSTADGLAIAWAVTEYLLDRVRARALFATHFHELTGLEHPGAVNLSMQVLERAGEIVFLKKVRPGPADSSYGIHVARLAGVPESVLRRAREIAQEIRQRLEIRPPGGPRPSAGGGRSGRAAEEYGQASLFSPLDIIRDEIAGLDLNRLTPLEALNRIARWREELRRQPQPARPDGGG